MPERNGASGGPAVDGLVLFDVDGTLVRVDGAGREALRLALLEVYGETGPIDSFDFHGKTDPYIVRGLLSAAGRSSAEIEERLAVLWERYVARLRVELTRRSGALHVYPGVVDLLRELRADSRFTVGLVTGNVEAGARAKLAACGLGGIFSFGAFGSDSERRADLPMLAVERGSRATGRRWDPDRILVVGDTPDDILCARAAGVRVLAVGTGRYSVETLARHGADAVVPVLTGALPVVQELVGRNGAASRN